MIDVREHETYESLEKNIWRKKNGGYAEIKSTEGSKNRGDMMAAE